MNWIIYVIYTILCVFSYFLGYGRGEQYGEKKAIKEFLIETNKRLNKDGE